MVEAKQRLVQALLQLRNDPYSYMSQIADGNETPETQNTRNKRLETLPLLENDLLDETAQLLCENALTGQFQNIDTNSTNIILEKLGYDAISQHVDATGIIILEYIDPIEGSELLFNNFARTLLEKINNAAEDSSEDMPAFLDSQYKELGIGFCGGFTQIAEKQQANIYMLVLVMARPRYPQPNWIQCGHVYLDANYDNKFDPGEKGLENVAITDRNGVLLAKTIQGGGYCFRRPRMLKNLYIDCTTFRDDYSIYNSRIERDSGGVLYEDIPLHNDPKICDINDTFE